MSAKIFLVCLAAVSFGLASAHPNGLDPASEGVESTDLPVKSDDRLTPQEREMRTLLKLKLAILAQFKGGPLQKGSHPGAGAFGSDALLGSKFGEDEGNLDEYRGQPQHDPSPVHSEVPALTPDAKSAPLSQISEDHDDSPPATSHGTPQSSYGHPATRTKRDHKGNLKACAAGAGAFAATNGMATAVAPNPFTAVVGAISGVIAAVCGIVENNS